MKALFLIPLSLMILSCTGQDFKVSECVQKPDESSIWEITAFNEGSAVLNQITKVSNTQTKEVNLPGGYIKTKCRR
jgi:hypothetical protein